MLEKHNVAQVSVTTLITSVQFVPEGPDIRKLIKTTKTFFGAICYILSAPFSCLNIKIEKFVSLMGYILIKQLL